MLCEFLFDVDGRGLSKHFLHLRMIKVVGKTEGLLPWDSSGRTWNINHAVLWNIFLNRQRCVTFVYTDEYHLYCVKVTSVCAAFV